jgi:hypothetical protein
VHPGVYVTDTPKRRCTGILQRRVSSIAITIAIAIVIVITTVIAIAIVNRQSIWGSAHTVSRRGPS